MFNSPHLDNGEQAWACFWRKGLRAVVFDWGQQRLEEDGTGQTLLSFPSLVTKGSTCAAMVTL